MEVVVDNLMSDSRAQTFMDASSPRNLVSRRLYMAQMRSFVKVVVKKPSMPCSTEYTTGGFLGGDRGGLWPDVSAFETDEDLDRYAQAVLPGLSKEKARAEVLKDFYRR